MCRSSLPVISPLTCRVAPSLAIPLDELDDVAGYVESIGAIFLASPGNTGVVSVDAVDLGDCCGCCCGSGLFAGASVFLSPHIYASLAPSYAWTICNEVWFLNVAPAKHEA
jgi:hypothetical protein